MRTLLTYLLFTIGISTFAQSTERWTAFYNEETELKGFKNAKGEVMIEPVSSPYTAAKEFDHIMVMSVRSGDSLSVYYLTKSGRKVGFDSLHIYDNGTDCESEGFIRFRDQKTDKVGMFDKNGDIAIPAEYNELSRVNNGLVWALKGAEKEYFHKKSETGCNHYSWKGGQELLINTKNEVLAKNTKDHFGLDCFSMTVQNEPSTDSTKVSYKGTNGKYYTFTDFEKEFLTWLKTELIPDLSLAKMTEHTMDSILIWGYQDEPENESKTDFLTRNYNKIESQLLLLKSDSTNYQVSHNSFPGYDIFVDSDRDKYYNTCGETRWQQYPEMTLLINHYIDGDLRQNHINFFKTDKGYRLIGATIRH